MAALTRWSPLEEFASIVPREFFGRDLFSWLRPDGEVTFEWRPRSDMVETEDEIIVHVELPGVDPKDMEVNLQERMLTIRGEKRTEQKEEEKGRAYSERFFGSFERRLILPAEVDASKIQAELKEGVLQVHLPKVAPAKPEARRIEIKAG